MSVELTESMDALLDADLDDFADLPEFLTPPPGTYNTLLKMAVKIINEKMCVEIGCTINNVEELNDPNQEPPKEGDIFNQIFFMDNEFGQGAFKKCTKELKAALGVSSTRQLIEATKDGLECLVISGVKKDKEDKTKLYTKIENIFLV